MRTRTETSYLAWVYACDVQTGIESKFQHIGLFLLSWLVKFKLVISLQPLSRVLLKISRLFDVIGTNSSGFYMLLKGNNRDGNTKEILFVIVGHKGDGSYIPCISSILMAKKLAHQEVIIIGAAPCIGFINLTEYLDALKNLSIEWRVTRG